MTTSTPSFPENTGFQYVPVPNEHYSSVLQFIATLIAPSGTPISTPRTVDPTTPDNSTRTAQSRDDLESIWWTDSQVIDFANKKGATPRTYRRIMDALAKRPGEWLSIDDLAELTGLSREVVKNFRTQIYRHVHAHLDTKLPAFPGAWGADIVPKRTNVVWYRASTAQVEQWERVRPHLS